MTLVVLAIGILLTLFPVPIREYCFKQYKQGAEKTGVLMNWVDRYPSYIVFRITGIVVLVIGILLMIVLALRLQD